MKHLILVSLLILNVNSALAQVSVVEPWVRATVPQQKATGAFLQLSTQQDTRLIAATSPLAKTVEIHEMSMENNIMKMREVPALDLPAGKTIELKPGGYHIMMLDLKRQIKVGELVPMTLIFEGKDKNRETIELKMPARPLGSTTTSNHTQH